MQRICLLMEQQKPFLQSNIKISDVASLLGTNSRYVSDCIKTVRGCSFTHFVNKYRIDYAQQLMRQQPGIKITEVYIKSGFANETSFFRTFKMIVGMTPKEWMAQND
jgi:YesN/AraC family two-component response regulator